MIVYFLEAAHAMYASIDKAHVFVRSIVILRFSDFSFPPWQGEKNPICKACHDEDSNVTDHFDNRRLSKRSVTSDFFFPARRPVTSLPPGRPRVTTLTTATGRHYRLRLSLLTTFIAELGYVPQTYSTRRVGRDSDYGAVTPAAVSAVARRRAQRAFTRLPRKTRTGFLRTVIVNSRGADRAEARLTSADNRFCHLRWR